MYIEKLCHELRINSIRTEDHPLYKDARKLYSICFPLHEQRESSSQARILKNSEYHFGAITSHEKFVGLALYWETDRFIYVEHLCIMPDLRGTGYGAATLKTLCSRNKSVILEIDPPVDDISIRRRGFYERCGFKENSHSHIHPPYHRGNKGHALVIMSYPEPISLDVYNDFHVYLETIVMDDVFN